MSIKTKLFISLSPEELLETTSEVAARYNVGIRPQTSLIAAICNKSGVDLDAISLSKTTVYRKRYKQIEDLGDKIREKIMDTLKGKHLYLHFDGKQVKQMEKDLKIIVSYERIAISVTSPDIDDIDDILLGVVQTPSSKGSDQVEAILKNLEYYDITDNIYAICCDKTASNTGSYNGTGAILASTFDVLLLWFMCRRHILEVHISHFMYALTGIKTKGPRRTLYMNLQKAWPEIQDKLDCNNFY